MMSDSPKMKNFIQNEEGFTIQEILVVLVISSILISLSLALFQFTNELFQGWQGTNELKSDANRIVHNIALDIQRSNGILERTDTTLLLSSGSRSRVKYSFSHLTLKRNDVDLTPKKVTRFLVHWEDITDKKNVTPVFRVKVLVQSRWTSYESEMICRMTPSSKSDLISSR